MSNTCTTARQDSVQDPEVMGWKSQTLTRNEGAFAISHITMNKARGGDGIPAELFQILEDDALKVLQ